MSNHTTTSLDERGAAMHAFLDRVLDHYRIESLSGDASFRRYHRIYIQGDGAKTSYLLMDAPPDKERVDHFVGVAGVLAQAVHVPKIFAKDMAQGFLLLEDFGDVEFAQAILDDTKKPHLYTQALTALMHIAKLPTSQAADQWQIEAYDAAKLLEEMMLFWQWFLPYVGVSMDEALWQQITEITIQGVEAQPKVIVHRDYHSRNLMVADGKLGIIDFQDALVGADTYDLVSLVRDAYIDEPDSWVNAQIEAFYQLAGITRPLADFVKDVNVMGVQRHLKVLGIFVRLYQRDGKARYLDDLPKVLNDLIYEVRWLSTHDSQNSAVWMGFLSILAQEIQPALSAMQAVSSSDQAH